MSSFDKVAPVLKVISRVCVLMYEIWRISLHYVFKYCLFVENCGTLHLIYSIYRNYIEIIYKLYTVEKYPNNKTKNGRSLLAMHKNKH